MYIYLWISIHAELYGTYMNDQRTKITNIKHVLNMYTSVEDELFVLHFKNERLWPELVCGARNCWASWYGNTRKSYKKRSIPIRKQKAKSEVALIQKRRESVTKFIQAVPEGQRRHRPSQSSKAIWDTPHQQEADFNATKHMNAFVMAAGDGHLLPEECDPDMHEDVLGCQAAMLHSQLKREQVKSNKCNNESNTI